MRNDRKPSPYLPLRQPPPLGEQHFTVGCGREGGRSRGAGRGRPAPARGGGGAFEVER